MDVTNGIALPLAAHLPLPWLQRINNLPCKQVGAVLLWLHRRASINDPGRGEWPRRLRRGCCDWQGGLRGMLLISPLT